MCFSDDDLTSDDNLQKLRHVSALVCKMSSEVSEYAARHLS